MGETSQIIITAAILAVAIAWTVRRLFSAPKKECGCCSQTNTSECGGCPLLDACKKGKEVVPGKRRDKH